MITSTAPIIHDVQLLKAGVFSIGYQNGFIRHINYGNIEVIRSIYMALRDQNWLTYEHTIENEVIDDQGDHFLIKYDCFYLVDGKRIFKWRVAITGTSDSVITFEIHGEAIIDVLKNRAGICVLHPVKHTAGYPCELIHGDDTKIKKTFPVAISAENPFKNLKAFRWRCHLDWYYLEFEGDLFETEDQRNWSDASYKTFCTPLSRPFPVLLKAGEKIHQKVIFKAETDLLPVPDRADNAVELLALEKKSSLPKIGVAASTEVDSFTPDIIEALQDLHLSHYRVEVTPSWPDWLEKFASDCQHASILNLPLEIALHIKDVTLKELENFYTAVAQLKPRIKQIILLSLDNFATESSLIQEVTSIKKHIPNAKVGAGTDYNYRELNCNRFDGGQLDFISYSIDPQEHAIDDLTIIENIAAQADTVYSARELYGEAKDINIASLTLKRRFNPAATESKDKILPNVAKTDRRQTTNFAAAFTLGSIKTLAQTNASSVTLFQTVGNQGILSAEGKKYPVYNLLKEILVHANSTVIHTVSNQPLVGDALLFHHERTFKLLMVNYTAFSQRFVFRKDHYTLAPYEIKIESIT
jgi:D-apionolactonase